MEKEEKGEVEMPKKEFVEEHRKLARVLRKGGKSERHAEAKKQARELRKHHR